MSFNFGNTSAWPTFSKPSIQDPISLFQFLGFLHRLLILAHNLVELSPEFLVVIFRYSRNLSRKHIDSQGFLNWLGRWATLVG
jgi:hypothetical protein